MNGQNLSLDDEELACLIDVGENSRVEFKETLAGNAPRFGVGIPTAQRLLNDAGHPPIDFTIEPTHLLAKVMAAPERGGESLWERDATNRTIHRCVKTLTQSGDLNDPCVHAVSDSLALIPGDLALMNAGSGTGSNRLLKHLDVDRLEH